MIVRVRTNLGASRLDISPSSSIEDLKKKIIEKLNIIECDDISVAFDLPGERPIEDGTVESNGLKNGDEIFILGKFSEIVVEKSYVNEKHEVVQAGKKLKLTEPPVNKNQQPIVEPDQPVAPIVEKAEVHNNENIPAERAENPSTSPTAFAAPADPEFDPALYRFEDDQDDDGVRAPDEVQRMQLVDDPMANIMDRLTPEDMAQLEQYHANLIETGLDEYEIETFMTEFRNDLLAQRMAVGEDDLQGMEAIHEMLLRGGVPPVTSLEELEALLRNTNIGRQARQNLNQVYGPAPTRKQRREAERKAKKEEKKRSGGDEDEAIIRSLQQHSSGATATTNNSRRLQQAGQSILQPMLPRQPSASSSSSSSSSASATAADSALPLRSQSAHTSHTTNINTLLSLLEEEEEEDVEVTTKSTKASAKKAKKKPARKPTTTAAKAKEATAAVDEAQEALRRKEAQRSYLTSGREQNAFGLLDSDSDSDSDEEEEKEGDKEGDKEVDDKEAVAAAVEAVAQDELSYALAMSLQETLDAEMAQSLAATPGPSTASPRPAPVPAPVLAPPAFARFLPDEEVELEEDEQRLYAELEREIGTHRQALRDITQDLSDARIRHDVEVARLLAPDLPRPTPAATTTTTTTTTTVTIDHAPRREGDRVELMRRFLEDDIPLPDWLAREITGSADDALLQYTQQVAANPSTNVTININTSTTTSSQPPSAQPSLPEYDEDDEMLARAIQASLEDL